MLYSNYNRDDWSIKQYGESTFQFIERSAWPIASLIRDFVNKNKRAYNNDLEFSSKLKSKDDKQHDAAMLELLLYVFLLNSELTIKRNQRKTNSKTPDFKVRTKENSDIFLECTLAANAMESPLENKKKESVMQFIEGLDQYPYFISADFNEVSDKSISKKKLLKFLDNIMNKEQSNNADLTGFKYIYYGEGWEIEFGMIRKQNQNVKRSRGITMQPAKIIDNFKRLYSALNGKKPAKYKLDGSAYIICLGIDDLTANEEEFTTALFGPNRLDEINLSYGGKGFFVQDGIPTNTSVSAVMFCKTFKEFGLSETKLSLWHNPFATNPIQKGLFPVDEVLYHTTSDKLSRNIIVKPDDLFEKLKIDKIQYHKFRNFEYRTSPIES